MEEVPVSLLLSIFSGIEFNLFSADVLFSFLAIILLIVSSAFISGAEVAYFSLDSSELEELEKDGETVLKLLKNPNQLLATILIANNFINVGIIVISAFLTSIAISFPEGSNLEFVFQVIVITSLLVLFGEITPKVYANNNPISFSLKMSKPLVFLEKLFYPLSYILVTTTSFIDKRLAAKQTEISIEEISKADRFANIITLEGQQAKIRENLDLIGRLKRELLDINAFVFFNSQMANSQLILGEEFKEINEQLKLFNALKDKVDSMVVMGSVSRHYPELIPTDYVQDKQQLHEACRLESIRPNGIPVLHLDLGFLEGTNINNEDPTAFNSDYNTDLNDIVDTIIFWASHPSIRQVEFTWKLTEHVMKEFERTNPNLDPSRIQI